MLYEFNLSTVDAKKALKDILGSEIEKLPILCEGTYEFIVTDKSGTAGDFADVIMTPVVMTVDTDATPTDTFPLYRLDAQVILNNLKATFPAFKKLAWAVPTTTNIYPVAVIHLIFGFRQCGTSSFGIKIELKKA